MAGSLLPGDDGRRALRPGGDDGATVDDGDRVHLRRCIELARTTLDAGDERFGSVLVDADGSVLFEDHDHVASGDSTRHPEFAIARWAAQHLPSDQRAAATVYTSGEHCPMCAAAHAWVGLGRIVYDSSSAQLGARPAPMQAPSIGGVAPGVPVEGPVAGLDEEVHDLHRRFHGS
ncbi:nucleoside deaminase [Geodermatophilus sp. DF01-2]|uniref:nucleoside deaminase n=1 Tax=Geodermatophilus sp. DF01-2 TaxID=2559610 RepID=UPI001074876D|nr:nucleoside deaminase [Geodermatophilus sp. DF01_2]TFV57918.1 nucleoside deaminase [Geodermatophilus sp. DF01_2]